MHESSLCRDIVAKVKRISAEAGGRRVKALKLRIGMLAQISPDHLRDHFQLAARGTEFEDARVDVCCGEELDDTAQAILLESVVLV